MALHLGVKGWLQHVIDVPTSQIMADREWFQLDLTIKCELIKFLHSDMIPAIQEKRTAHDIWTYLDNTYERKSTGQRVYLKRQIKACKLEEGELLHVFLDRFNLLVQQFKNAGGTTSKEELVTDLLAALPEEYETHISVLEALDVDNDLDIERAQKYLLEVELRKRVKKPDSDTPRAFASKGKFKPKEGSGSNEAEVKCFTCGEVGYKSPGCPKKAPNKSKKFKGKSKKSSQANVTDMSGTSHAFLGAMTTAENASCAGQSNHIGFVVDSGATHHYVNDKTFMLGCKQLSRPFEVNVAKAGTSLKAYVGGRMSLVTYPTEREKSNLSLEEVFYTPELTHNLLSVRRIEAAGGKVTFTNGKVVVQNREKTVAAGKRVGNLYTLRFHMAQAAQGEANSATVAVSKTDLWHRRLGHLGIPNVVRLINGGLTSGKMEKVSAENQFCETCTLGKMARLLYDGTRPKTSQPLERIHSDVCGPMETTAIDGSKYFVTFLDDYTHFTVTYLLKEKSEVLSKFKLFVAMASTHFERKVKRLRSDRGGEYSSTAMKQFCGENGIVLETNPAHNPQLNGVAERLNRTLTEKARSMLLEYDVAKRMWGEAIMTATYLTNRSPTVALKETTPFEKWFGVKPNISNLKVFGCHAYAHVPDSDRGKFDPKSRPLVMVGYDQHGYRLYNGHKIVVTRNVIFDEDSKSSITMSTSLDNQAAKPVTPVPSVKPSPVSEISNDFGPTIEPESASSAEESDGDFQTPPLTVRRNPARTRRAPRRLTYDAFEALSAVSWIENEPIHYRDVFGRDDEAEWRSAIASEISSLNENETWEVVERPENAKLLGSRWVFKKVKEEPNGGLKYKARLVARGFQQKEGIDFRETYAPVARLPMVRVVLAMAAQFNLQTRHLDVTTAFLYGHLKETVYLRTPDGVQIPNGKVIKLKRSLYGLKQSPRCWNDRFNEFIIKLGFTRSQADYCFYSWRQDDLVVYLLIYVDDTLMVGNATSFMNSVIKKLSTEFKMKDLGPVKRFMGLNIETYDGHLRIHQTHYINQILKKFNMADCKHIATPMEVNLKLERGVTTMNKLPYRELIGSLMYLVMGSRPDLSFAVGYFSRYQEGASESHFKHLKRVLRYLQGTKNLSLEYTKDVNSKPISCYVDADWGSDESNRKSTSGYLVKLFNCPIIWASKKQPVVALSSTEAEFVAATVAVCEILWLRKLCVDLFIELKDPVTVYEDNQGAIAMSKNCETRRSKHIDIKYNFIRDCVAQGQIELKFVTTREQLADVLTKSLSKEKFEFIVNQILSKREC